MTCEMCGGALGLLGTLGDMDHFQCRDCGWAACDTSPEEPIAMKKLVEFGCYVWVESGVLCCAPTLADGSASDDPGECGPVEMVEDPAFLAAANAALGTSFEEDNFS